MTTLHALVQLLAQKAAALAVTAALVVGGAGLALAETGSEDPGSGETTTTTSTTVDDEDGDGDPAPTATALTEDTEDEGEHDRPENHGFHVSQAARGLTCPTADDDELGDAGEDVIEDEETVEYRNHGECVSAVARSTAGKSVGDTDEVEALDEVTTKDGKKGAGRKGPPAGKGPAATFDPGR